MKGKIILLLLVSNFIIFACENDKTNTHIKTIYKTVYKDNPFVVEDSIIKKNNSILPIEEKVYSDVTHHLITSWLDSIPENYRDSLLLKKIIVEKIYYLSNIYWDNEEKINHLNKFNSKIENHISIRIGTYQAIPSVIFSTNILPLEESKYKKDCFVIRLNRLMY